MAFEILFFGATFSFLTITFVVSFFVSIIRILNMLFHATKRNHFLPKNKDKVLQLTATAYSSLLTPYSLLLTPYSLLLTPYSSLLTPYSSLLTPYSSLLTPHSLLLTPYSLLLTPYSLLFTAHYLLFPFTQTIHQPRIKHSQNHQHYTCYYKNSTCGVF